MSTPASFPPVTVKWAIPSFGVAGQSMCYIDIDGMVTMGPLQLVIIFMWCKTGLTAEYPATLKQPLKIGGCVDIQTLRIRLSTK